MNEKKLLKYKATNDISKERDDKNIKIIYLIN